MSFEKLQVDHMWGLSQQCSGFQSEPNPHIYGLQKQTKNVAALL